MADLNDNMIAGARADESANAALKGVSNAPGLRDV